MVTPLEKAHKDPESMKARILAVARRFFGEYDFQRATTRMIAQEVGIDISTLHYHWGEKKDLYEAVILDINKDLVQKLVEIEEIIRGLPLIKRLAIAIDLMTDYLFEHREISNLILHRYSHKTRREECLEQNVFEITTDIIRFMGLEKESKSVSPRMILQVLAVMNSIHNFIAGESFFRPMVRLERKEYILLVKETVKFIHIPAVENDGRDSS
jgi:AcrR family transcriptional regulator